MQTSHQMLMQTSPGITLNAGANLLSETSRGLKPKDGDGLVGFKAVAGIGCPIPPTPRPHKDGNPRGGKFMLEQWSRAAHGSTIPGPSPTARCHAVGALHPVGLLPRGGSQTQGSSTMSPSLGPGTALRGPGGGSSDWCVRFCSGQSTGHPSPRGSCRLQGARSTSWCPSGCPRCPMGTPGGSGAPLCGEVAPSAGTHGHCTGLPPTPKTSACGDDGCLALHPRVRDSTLLHGRGPLCVPGAPRGLARCHQVWCVPEGR